MQSPSHREPFNTVIDAFEGSRPGTPGSNQPRPMSAGSGGMMVRPSSAGSRSMALTTRDAWGAPESPKASFGSPGAPVSPQVSGTRLRNHAHAIMARRSREEMAQDVYLLQTSLKDAEIREKKLLTEKQRLEAELRKANQALSRDKSMFDPCASRAPTLAEQTSMVAKPEPALVNKLKDTNRQLRAARDELANELTTLQRSTRATRASELEAEARMYLEEMDRQKKIAALMEDRLRDCQSALAEAQMELNKKKHAAKTSGTMSLASTIYGADDSILNKDKANVDNEAAPRSLRQELQMATIQAGRGLTGGSKELRATLASMQSAHRLLVAEAAALRNFLPEGCSWSDLDPQRWKQAGVSPRGASAILRFLRTHEVRLHGELSGLPGAKRKNKDVKPPAELEGPDYHVLGKDGTMNAGGGPRTPPNKGRGIPTPPVKEPVDVEAEMAWKAEAARLRKQMDDHMNNLNQLVQEDSVLGDLGRSSLSMTSASPFTSTTHFPTQPAGMLAAQVDGDFPAPADQASVVSIEEHVSTKKQTPSVQDMASSEIKAADDTAAAAVAMTPSSESMRVQAEFDKARQEAEDLRIKMDAAEAELHRKNSDPVSDAIQAGGIPPIMIPPQSQLSTGSDFPRVESMATNAFHEQMPPLAETRESEDEGSDEDYGDDGDDFEDDYDEQSEDEVEVSNSQHGRMQDEAMTDTVAAGILVDSMDDQPLMGMEDKPADNSRDIDGIYQEANTGEIQQTPDAGNEITPTSEVDDVNNNKSGSVEEPDLGYGANADGDSYIPISAATPSSHQDYEHRDLDLSESNTSNTGNAGPANGADSFASRDPSHQAEEDSRSQLPDLEVSASDEMVSGSVYHGDSLFSGEEEDDDEEFPPRSPSSSDDGDDFMPADDDSEDDDVF